MLELIFGLIIIGALVYIVFRVIHSVAIGLLIIFLAFMASYMIFGSLPDLKAVPFIGKYLPSSGEAIVKIKNVLYSIEILDVFRDSEGNLLVNVANTGKLDAKNFTVFIDNQTVGIMNNPKDPLKSGQVAVIQTNWIGNFTSVFVQTEKSSAEYRIT
jgi:hypothetical protein